MKFKDWMRSHKFELNTFGVVEDFLTQKQDTINYGFSTANGYWPMAIDLGSIVIMDDNFKEEFDDKKTIFIEGMQSQIHLRPPRQYWAVTGYVVSNLDFSGETVLDAGCEDGVLGLLAKKNNADKVIGVEKEHYMRLFSQPILTKLRFEELILLNYWDKKDDFKFIQGDLTDKKLKKHDLSNVDTIIANIGPHDGAHSKYGNAHLAAINLIDKLPHVKRFVAGGYVNPMYNPRTLLGPWDAEDLLKEKGFKLSKYVSMVHSALDTNHVPALTMVYTKI